MDSVKETCACGKPGVYIVQRNKLKDGSIRAYKRCKECHARFMKIEMRKRYATPEGRAAILAALKRHYQRKSKAGMTL